ncbi:hypothetical protein [Clostridium hydrogenum]|nr:hypothetical protein [Clostridium hydrogenum]
MCETLAIALITIVALVCMVVITCVYIKFMLNVMKYSSRDK